MKLQGFLLPVLLTGFATVESARIPPLYKRQSITPADQAAAVKEGFTHSWGGYVKYAFGNDELRPVSNTGSNSRYLIFLHSGGGSIEFLLIFWPIFTEMDGEHLLSMP